MPRQIISWFSVLALMTAMATSVIAQDDNDCNCDNLLAHCDDPETDLLPAELALRSVEIPRGVYAVIPFNQLTKQETWENPCLAGVVIRTFWECLNPEKDVYKWAYLDTQFAQAAKNGKKIHLIIAPGFYSPQWVKKYPGVQNEKFHVPQGPDKGELQDLPLPWNDTYLDLWEDFVAKIGVRYGGKEALAFVSVTGPNSHNGEVNLPRKEEDDLTKWLTLVGNDPNELKNRMIKAYHRMLRHFKAVFGSKQKYFTLTLFAQSLPIKQNPVNQPIQQGYREELADLGAQPQFRDHFGVANFGLDASSGPFDVHHPWRLVEKYADKALTGFQTRAPNNLYDTNGDDQIDDGEKAPPAQREVMRQTLLNGIRYGGRFIEIYENDTLDPNLKGVIAAAAKLLCGEEKDCHCE